MKTKTYILTLSRTFPKGHPREGEGTHFEERVRCGIYYGKRIGDNSELLAKRHTIRASYELWKHRIDEVNAGRAVLSVRQWQGAPRRSKQRELFRLDRDSGIGVEKLWFYNKYCHSNYDPYGRDPKHLLEVEVPVISIRVEDDIVARNDGLTLEDWEAWFSNPRYDWSQPMAIIHFTNFRYCGLKEGSLPL